MTPITVVTGLLIRDGKILMCQRKAEKLFPLHWEFPGGKVEGGETLLQALQRELQEELQLNIDEAISWYEDTMTYSSHESPKTYHVTFFLIRNFRGEPINTEFEQIGWFSLDDLDTLQHLSGNTNILRKIREEGLPE